MNRLHSVSDSEIHFYGIQQKRNNCGVKSIHKIYNRIFLKGTRILLTSHGTDFILYADRMRLAVQINFRALFQSGVFFKVRQSVVTVFEVIR